MTLSNDTKSKTCVSHESYFLNGNFAKQENYGLPFGVCTNYNRCDMKANEILYSISIHFDNKFQLQQFLSTWRFCHVQTGNTSALDALHKLMLSFKLLSGFCYCFKFFFLVDFDSC